MTIPVGSPPTTSSTTAITAALAAVINTQGRNKSLCALTRHGPYVSRAAWEPCSAKAPGDCEQGNLAATSTPGLWKGILLPYLGAVGDSKIPFLGAREPAAVRFTWQRRIDIAGAGTDRAFCSCSDVVALPGASGAAGAGRMDGRGDRPEAGAVLEVNRVRDAGQTAGR
ncbi:hypothetical protein GCM10009854_26360 [Saccharopolyspora halophila]|uniref:Uncharacterized protein n=1 Tax=Saccharopolyspora halophila TaxID=405551 RepID=A0ABN3GB98_9PSEU